MSNLKDRTDALTGDSGNPVEAIAGQARDEGEVPVLELHQLGRRARDKVTAAEPTAADHPKLAE